MHSSYTTVSKDATLYEVLERMRAGEVQLVLVVSRFPPQCISEVLGLITREHIAASVEEALDLFG